MLPWYILSENGVLITSPTIPLSIQSSKEIIYAENAVPGLNFTPKYPNRQGNNKIAFTIPIINRRGLLGNANYMAQFEMLRNSDTPTIKDLIAKKDTISFKALPQVVYSWGTHLPPLLYWVTKCDFEHTGTLTNRAGFSQYTMVSMELELDETSKLYNMYKLVRGVQATLGTVESIINATTGGRPY